MPKLKKKTNVAKEPRTNKSAWIRSQPEDMPAKEVVDKAKREGIKLSIAQVYTARSTAKKLVGRRKGGAAPLGAAPRRAARGGGAADDLRHQFVRLAIKIGTDEAQRLLDAIVDVQTPMPR